jgi:hypothetical protein
MYNSAAIARGEPAADVQARTPDTIDIQWDYGEAGLSMKAAQQMVKAFGIGNNPVAAPDRTSRHITGQAIDMTIKGWKNKRLLADAL